MPQPHQQTELTSHLASCTICRWSDTDEFAEDAAIAHCLQFRHPTVCAVTYVLCNTPAPTLLPEV